MANWIVHCDWKTVLACRHSPEMVSTEWWGNRWAASDNCPSFHHAGTLATNPIGRHSPNPSRPPILFWKESFETSLTKTDRCWTTHLALEKPPHWWSHSKSWRWPTKQLSLSNFVCNWLHADASNQHTRFSCPYFSLRFFRFAKCSVEKMKWKMCCVVCYSTDANNSFTSVCQKHEKKETRNYMKKIIWNNEIINNTNEQRAAEASTRSLALIAFMKFEFAKWKMLTR